MDNRNMVCITCPLGCRLDVGINDGNTIEVKGNGCKRGIDYAVKECTNPTRTLTTTVAVSGGMHKVVPVKSKGEIPKKMIMECMEIIKKVRVGAPVKAGQVLIPDIMGCGVDIIATGDC